MDCAHADGAQGGAASDRDGRETAGLGAVATLAIRAVAPTVGRPVCREAARVVGTRLDRGEGHGLHGDCGRAALRFGGRRDGRGSGSGRDDQARCVDGGKRGRIARPRHGRTDAPASARVDQHGAELRRPARDDGPRGRRHRDRRDRPTSAHRSPAAVA